MENTLSGFTVEQLMLISQLQAILEQMKEKAIHVSGVQAYEASIFKDAEGKPYVGIS